MNDIPILYRNKTGRDDFTVVVFTKNEIDAPSPVVVWRTLKSQTSTEFIYPAEVAVGAQWTDSGSVQYRAGPFPATPGSTWKMTMPTPAEPPELSEGKYMQNNLMSLYIL